MEKILYKKEKDKVKCLACNWGCSIGEGQTGVCGVRANIGGKLRLLVYGKTTGLAVDPIEKKPFYHFLPGTNALSFGTLGCNFGCPFCQNWEISQITKSKLKTQNQKLIDEVSSNYSPEEIVEVAIKNNCASIAYTYNEPTIWVEFAYDTMKLAKKAGLKSVFVSNGYQSKESFDLIKNYLDAVNIDLKGATDGFYLKYCKARIEPVLTNIERFWKAGIWVEVTTMLIEGVNDGERDLKFMANFLKNVSPSIPWHLSAMHPDYKMTEGRVTPYGSLENAYKIGKEAGLKYVYAYTTEKSTELDSTYCPKCGELLIERHYFSTEIKNFKDGFCGKCGEKIAGFFD